MCEPIICGTVLTIYATAGFVSLALDRRSNKRRSISRGLTNFVWDLRSQQRNSGIIAIEDEDQLLKYTLHLGKSSRKVVKAAHEARDQVLFGDVPPDVRSAGKYVKAQGALGKIDQRLLYVLDPELLLATRMGEPLLMSSDLSSCMDGTYSTSVEFAADYRNMVGENAFEKRLEGFQQVKNLVSTQPWYAERADYKSRLNTSTIDDMDSF